MARASEYGQTLDWLELNTLASFERRCGRAPNPDGAVQHLMEERTCVSVVGVAAKAASTSLELGSMGGGATRPSL
jgi:hypothetical protein